MAWLAVQLCAYLKPQVIARLSRAAAPMLSHINVGTGVDCKIRDLAETIAVVTRFTGQLVFDHTKPDGAPRKLMDTSKLNAFGWSPAIGLREGIQSSYDWFVANQDKFRR